MILRQASGLILLILGAWLLYGASHAVIAFMQRGGGLSSALFEPPTSAIRIAGAVLITSGGVLAGLKRKGGGVLGILGSAVFIALGALMASTGTSQGLWLDELIYGVAALTISALILTFRQT